MKRLTDENGTGIEGAIVGVLVAVGRMIARRRP